METTTRHLVGRVRVLATVLATICLTAPALAQIPPTDSLPPRPLEFTNGPEVRPDPGPALNTNDSAGPGTGVAPIAIPNQTPTRVWTVTPSGRSTPSLSGLMPARQPSAPAQPSGSYGYSQGQPPSGSNGGWRGFAQSGGQNRNSPAAMLAMPRGAVTPTARPDWSWHGYDTYNHVGRVVNSPATASNPAITDMAPYMKYAHLWRLSQNAPAATVVAAPPASSGPATGTPSGTNVEWRGPISVTPGAPAVSQGNANMEFGGWNANSLQPANFSAPRVAPVPSTPAPPAAPGNRLPLQVRQRVSQICGDKAQNLVVEQLSPIRLRIAFLVHESADAESLTLQLAALPELAPYKCDFEVQIGQ